MRTPFPLVAIVLAFLVGCGDGDGDEQTVSAQLRPVNASGVDGTAELTLEGDRLDVRIDARGLTPNRVHGQTIHGFPAEDRAAACPRPDGQELLGARDAQSQYGPVVRAIEPFPTVGEDGALEYRLTIDVDVTDLEPLPRRVIVLHGAQADPDGDGRSRYHPDLPVACGELEPRGEAGRTGAATSPGQQGEPRDDAGDGAGREGSRGDDGRHVPAPLEDKLE